MVPNHHLVYRSSMVHSSVNKDLVNNLDSSKGLDNNLDSSKVVLSLVNHSAVRVRHLG
jgi:hypothetical protein